MSVDWNTPIKFTRHVKGNVRTEYRFTVTCPVCGQSRLLKKADAQKTSGGKCKLCHLREIAPKGYQATVQKHGKDFALTHVRDYRLSHPSNLEQQVISQLEASRIPYQREVICGSWLIDFVIGKTAIEVNGSFAHRHDNPHKVAQKVHAIREAGYQLVTLHENSLFRLQEYLYE